MELLTKVNSNLAKKTDTASKVYPMEQNTKANGAIIISKEPANIIGLMAENTLVNG